MPGLPRSTYGLLCVDPPYGKKFRSGLRHASEKFDVLHSDDGSFDLRLCGEQSVRLLMGNRHIYVFGFHPDQIPETFRLGGSCELIWDKGQVGPGDLKQPWGPQHEPITFGMYVASKANKESGYGNLSARLRSGSVLRFNRKNSRSVKGHPTEKPVPLMRAIIESSSSLGDTVFDPVMGIGSTLVAATIEGRLSVGIEIKEQFCEIAAKRLQKVESLVDELKSQ